MKKLLIIFTFGLIIGTSIDVSADTTPKCTIDLSNDSVTCSNNKDRWTCRQVNVNEWKCEGKLASWTTDCPYCPYVNNPSRDKSTYPD